MNTEVQTKPIESSSIGYKLLSKMGWTGGGIGMFQFTLI
jgi:G-patch domain